MRTSRKLTDLLPHVRAKVETLIRRMADIHGVRIIVGTTYRSPTDQAAQVVAGRSAASRSWHQLRRAVDLYVVDPSTGKADVKARCRALYETMGTEAAALGFRWLGFKVRKTAAGKTFSDPYHVEMRDGMTYAQASADLKRRGVA